MYMQVTSPTIDSTIRLQLSFQSLAVADSEPTDPEILFRTRVHEVLHAPTTFLVVYQPAPNAFILVPKQSDVATTTAGSRPRFHVVIGPQLCSCSEISTPPSNEATDAGEHRESRCSQIPCVHILFVLFRVLRAPLDDPSMALVPLPTAKAESLIQAHLKHKFSSQSTDFTRGQRCYLSQIPLSELKSRISQSLNHIQSSATSQPIMTPLVIPKPIHATRMQSDYALDDRTPKLLAAIHTTLQNSPDCCELSKLTTGIRPSTRHEVASADAAATSSTTAASRTSSMDSTDSGLTAACSVHHRTARSARQGTTCWREEAVLLARRPRTVPQPEPPPRTNRAITRSTRYTCSTTFRPIRDYSPVVLAAERKLTPIHSSETSAENSLKHIVYQNEYNVLHRSDEKGHIESPALRRVSSFRHWNSGLFKPIVGAKSVGPTALDDGADSVTAAPAPVVTNPSCALCLQSMDNGLPSTETVVQCQSSGNSQRCVAAFHGSCCQIWLEEAATDGDSPHCPVCLCHWDTLPFDWPTKSVPEVRKSPCLCSEPAIPVQTSDITQTTNNDPSISVKISNTQAHTRERSDPPEQLPEDRGSGVRETVSVEPRLPVAGLPTSTSSNLNCPFPDYKLCASAFSLEIADGIASRICPQIRQLALQHAAHLTVRRILIARQQHQLQTKKDRQDTADEVRDTTRKSQNHAQTNESTEEPDCLRVMFRLIQHLFDDPVDAVFIDALRAFRELLGYLVCFNTETQTALQRAIGPIIRRLLRFAGGASILWSLREHRHSAFRANPGLMHQNSTESTDSSSTATTGAGNSGVGLSLSQADVPTINNATPPLFVAPSPPNPHALLSVNQSNGTHPDSQLEAAAAPPANLRDRANLALASLVELAKGQTGALAIGRDVGCASDCLAVCGLHHMTRFVLSSAKFHATHLVGRLTLLDKLIRMDQATVPTSDPTQILPSKPRFNTGQPPISAPDRLARRHLCSSLVFARRHLIPPVPNSDLALCFPRLYDWQPTTTCAPTSTNKACPIDSTSNSGARQDAMDSLYNTQLKASRVARRVFLTAARALLTYDNRHAFDWNNVANNGPNSQQHPNYGAREFCPREFVELEISRTEAPLAAWLRNKLASLLYPNLVPGLDTPLIPIRMTVSEAQPSVPPRNAQHMRPSNANSYHNKSIVMDKRPTLSTSQTLGDVQSTLHQQPQPQPATTTNSPLSRTHSNSPVRQVPSAGGVVVDLSIVNSSSHSPSNPPIPPPRRPVCLDPDGYGRSGPRQRREISASRVGVKLDLEDPGEGSGIAARRNSWTPEPTDCNRLRGPAGNNTHCVRIALEPAYDLVPLSESGNYSSVSEGDDDDDDHNLEKKRTNPSTSDSDGAAEPTYGGRSLGSEAELQTEQAAVLRSALRRCSRSLRPLLPVPALSMVMEAFRSTNQIPSTDEYYESIDWIRGPILGQGAFSQCYQARDTRTGLLMAVKRIRLGGGSVFPILTDQAKLNPCSNTRRLNLGGVAEADAKQTCANPTHPKLSPEAAAQLAEVQAEVNIMLRLSHPNVLRLFGAVYCARRGLVDLFIEWMPGGSVTSLLRQYGAFNESVTLAYGVQVVRGLAYLHKNGILHRDLKGANLLVDTTGSVVRISDFGASARLSGEESVTGQFQGQVIGTFSFMAPEVLRGETYGRACDIWSVGCCLIEMLTSKPPWHDTRLTNRYALMFAIATSLSPPTYPEGLDSDVLNVLNACFSRNASQRPTASKLLTFRAFARLTEPVLNNNLRESNRSNQSNSSAAVEQLYSPSLPDGGSCWTSVSRRRRRRALSPRNGIGDDGGAQQHIVDSSAAQWQQQTPEQRVRRRVTQPVFQTTRVL